MGETRENWGIDAGTLGDLSRRLGATVGARGEMILNPAGGFEAYIRVSTEEQGETGYGLVTQGESIIRYAAREGLAIRAVWADDCSGELRPEFRRGLTGLLGRVEAGGVRGVVIDRPDRLARVDWVGLMVVSQLKEAGVAVHFTSIGRVDDKPEARFLYSVMAGHGHMDKALLLANLSKARIAKARGGRPVGNGTAPFGYIFLKDRAEGLRMVPNVPQEEHKRGDVFHDDTAVIRDIFRRFAYERQGTATIADEYTRLGVPTPSDRHPERFQGKRFRGRAEWARNYINNLLRNPVYIGQYRHFRKGTTLEPIEGGFRQRTKFRADDAPEVVVVPVPPIVDMDTWRLAQNRLDSHVRAPARHTYLIRGMVWCGCGARMTTKSNYAAGKGWKTKTYYMCHNRSKEGGYRCTAPYFDGAAVDGAVWGYLEHTILHPENLAAGLRAMREVNERDRTNLERNLQTLVAQLGDVEGRMGRLVSLYVAGNIPEDILDRERSTLGVQEVGIREGIRELEDTLAGLGPTDEEITNLTEFSRAIVAGLPHLSNDERRAILEMLRVRVTLSVEGPDKVAEVALAIPGVKGRVSLSNGGNFSGSWRGCTFTINAYPIRFRVLVIA